MTNWNSIALFFNLADEVVAADYSDNPDELRNYQRTTSNDALKFMDLGSSPATVPATEFINRYWLSLTRGRLDFGFDTARDHTGRPLVPTLRLPDDKPQEWESLIDLYLSLHAERVWLAAGGRVDGPGRRLIPSVVLIQNYHTDASAGFSSVEREFDGVTYLIGDRTHIKFDLNNVQLPNGSDTAKRYLGVLCHEFAHNFAEFQDLYGPGGAAGQWDLLGGSPTPGRMSEISSLVKEKIGWIDFRETVMGPRFARSNFSLRPYTTSGDAIKVVPDPDNNPHEYFLLEYRVSTGDEPWLPDGALEDDGLLIWHVNERIGVTKRFLAREAPFLDVERADFADLGKARRDTYEETDGALFPHGDNDSFTPTSRPSSAFYGDRASGLSIENIRVSRGRCRFSIDINIRSRVGWTTTHQDRAVAFRPYAGGIGVGDDVFIRDHGEAALLRMLGNQWFVVDHMQGWIGSWELTPGDHMPLVVKLTDSGDDLYMRDSSRAGIIGLDRGEWVTKAFNVGRIGGWNLNWLDKEVVADLDGDGVDEIVVAAGPRMGLFKFEAGGRQGRFVLKGYVGGNVGEWELGPGPGWMFAGRFRRSATQDVVLFRGDELGLIAWDPRGRGAFRLVRKEEGRVGGKWALNARRDTCVVGDFDGDGIDEIFVRSARYAAMFKWRGNRFVTVWSTSSPLPPLDPAKDEPALALRARFRLKVGKFYRADLPQDSNAPTAPAPRDCVLHVDNASNSLWILAWDEARRTFVVRQKMDGQFATNWPTRRQWNRDGIDRMTIGDFHSTGPDPTRTSQDYVGDHVEDIFIHNAWGTATVGVNHTEWDPIGNDDRVREEMLLTWIQHRTILNWHTNTW